MSSRENSSHIVWPPFLASPPVTLPGLVSGLKKSESWPASKVRRGQQAQATLLLEWAANNVPYYADSGWAAANLAAIKRKPKSFWDVWESLPLLTKADLRANGEAMYAREVPKVHLPTGKTITSGSTGTPVEVRTTAATRTIWHALTLREMEWYRRDFGKRMGVIRYVPKEARDPRGVVLPSWPAPFSQLRRTGPAGGIHVGYPVDVLAGWLRRFDPHYLTTHPSVVAALLEELGEGSGKPRALEQIIFLAEPVPSALEARLRDAWGVISAEYYSANETGYIAFRCAEYGKLHVQSESVLVEIVNDASEPCEIGEPGRLVVTPFLNLATPLIRYDIGDYASFGEPCACGRKLPVINEVLGRVRNLVRTPEGKRYWPVELGKFKAIASIRQFQYVQSAPDTIRLQLVLSQPLTEEEQNQVVEFARAALGYPFRVEIVPVPEIKRGPTGKYEEFLSLLPET